MANDAVILNGNDAPFVEDEFDAGETDIYPGNVLELDANGDVIKKATEHSLGTNAPGRGLVADLPFDPSYEKGEDVTGDGGVGERVRVAYVPVGGKVDARLAAGGDLADSTEANVGVGEVLEEANVGGLKSHDGTDTTGDGTGAATETVYDEGALYMALEAVDNSGAAAGVTNQAAIEVVRIA